MDDDAGPGSGSDGPHEAWTDAAPAPDGGGATEADTPRAAELAALQDRLHGAIGKVALAMSALPRYRHQTLADLGPLVLDPLVRDRIAIASAPQTGEMPAATAGIAIWASVSPEVDASIREQIAAGVFPVRLKPEDWTSGDINWLLDVIAPSERLATAVIAGFRRLAKGGELRMHPIIGRIVPAETLQRMGASPMRAEEAATAPPVGTTKG